MGRKPIPTRRLHEADEEYRRGLFGMDRLPAPGPCRCPNGERSERWPGVALEFPLQQTSELDADRHAVVDGYATIGSRTIGDLCSDQRRDSLSLAESVQVHARQLTVQPSVSQSEAAACHETVTSRARASRREPASARRLCMQEVTGSSHTPHAQCLAALDGDPGRLHRTPQQTSVCPRLRACYVRGAPHRVLPRPG